MYIRMETWYGYLPPASPILDGKGELLGYQGVDTDITERRKVEEALKESEFFFKESQKAAFIGSYKTDFLKGTWESSEVLDQIFGIDGNYEQDHRRDGLNWYIRPTGK